MTIALDDLGVLDDSNLGDFINLMNSWKPAYLFTQEEKYF